MNVNWQEYLDGSLGPEEMEMARALLAQDAGARKSLEHLKAFRKEVRRACLSEPVPLKRLEESMRGLRSRTRASGRMWTWAIAAAAAIAVAFFTARREPRQVELANLTSFESAGRWLRDDTAAEIPTMRFENARLVMAERGPDWGCYCMVMEGRLVHVRIGEEAILPGSGVVRGGRRFVVADHVSWRKGSLTFRVYGGTEELRWKIALRLA